MGFPVRDFTKNYDRNTMHIPARTGTVCVT